MKQRRVGLYLGISSIGGVVVEDGKVVSLAKFDLSSLPEKPEVESLSEGLRWEALVNKVLQQMQTEEKDIYLSVTDQDFIFRAFEIPLMRSEEIQSALVYEVEQHIPFKTEELMWDYGLVRFPKKKKMEVSFLGIRQQNFKRFQEILSHLGLNGRVFEPSSLSLIRVMKSQRALSRLKNYALLDFVESKGSLTFCYCDLPIFSQYFTISRGEKGLEYEKFVATVRLSFQYFKREFKDYEIDKLILISNHPDEALASLLKEELQIEIELLSAVELLGENATVENVKAQGAANRDYYPYKFKPILRSTQEQAELREKGIKVPLKIKPLILLAVFGLLLSVAIFAFLGNKVAIQKTKYKQAEAASLVPLDIRGLSPEEIGEKIKDKQSQLALLKEVTSVGDKISPFFEKLSSLLPQGVWLKDLSVTRKNAGYEGTLDGYVFLEDSYKERLGIDEFIANLGKDEVAKETFPLVEMVSSQREELGELRLTSFALKLSKYGR